MLGRALWVGCVINEGRATGDDECKYCSAFAIFFFNERVGLNVLAFSRRLPLTVVLANK